ncbi:MAG: rane protein [Candidatus Adlerbacteria bacterium]|nr:rane protein [Candidatus Adlerbacteria bacterium]
MSALLSFFSSTHITELVVTLGLLGVTAIVFAESGLLIGFFLPGDSMLFTAGILASQGLMNIWLLVPLVIAAAIIGDSVGYWFGNYIGPKLFTRQDSLLFKQKYVTETHRYFEKYGPYTIIIARFIPIVRTFAPVLAGVGNMNYSTFLIYNIIGGALWGTGVTLAGFWLGNTIPNIDHYLLPIIGLIVLISILPPLWQWYRRR